MHHNVRMKRNIFLVVLLLLVAGLGFAGENAKNKLALGMDVNAELLPDSDDPHIVFTPSIAYERLFCDISRGCLTGAASLCINPFDKICSLSVDVRCYSDKMTGYFVGVLPISDFNIYSLFDQNCHFRYGIGIEFGYDFILSRELTCEIKANPGLIFQDSALIVKMVIALNVGYRF